MTTEAIASIERTNTAAANTPSAITSAAPPQSSHAASAMSFGELIAQGLTSVETKIDNANRLVRAFALDDNVPLHEVTIALEEARLAIELTSTVRARLVDSYREIMNTQL